jgi:hypothetical protein
LRIVAYLPLLLVGLGELDLDSIDAIDAVDEEDEDEDEAKLHAILKFCYQRAFATVQVVSWCNLRVWRICT